MRVWFRLTLISFVANVCAAAAEPCKAPPELEQAVASGDPEAHAALGYWFAERNDSNCAVAAFRRAVEADGDSVMARYNLGVALLQQGADAAAVDHLEAAARLDPQNPLTLSALGSALAELGRKPEAIQTFERLLTIDPDDADAKARLAELKRPPVSPAVRAAAAMRAGDFATAEAAYREYLAGGPNNAAVHYNLGLAISQQRRYAEAEVSMRNAVRLKPDSATNLSGLGMVLARQQRLDEAIEIFRRLVELEPESSNARMSLGVVLADKGLKEEASEHFEKAVGLTPNSASARFQLGRTLYDLRRYEEAYEAFTAADDLAADNATTLRFLGMTLNRLEKRPEAVAALERSIAIQPRSDIAHEELARAFLKLGRQDDAIASLKQAVDLNPRNSAATATLLTTLYRAKSGEAAQYRTQMRELKKEEGATSRAQVLSNFALTAAESEDWDRAVAQLEEAVAVCDGCPIQALLRENLGLILWRSGNLAKAIEQLETAHALDKTDRDILYSLNAARAAADAE